MIIIPIIFLMTFELLLVLMVGFDHAHIPSVSLDWNMARWCAAIIITANFALYIWFYTLYWKNIHQKKTIHDLIAAMIRIKLSSMFIVDKKGREEFDNVLWGEFVLGLSQSQVRALKKEFGQGLVDLVNSEVVPDLKRIICVNKGLNEEEYDKASEKSK